MSELVSVGLDVGTTTTQMVVSRLTVENRASSFAVPDMAITRREIVYRSPVHFTPLLDARRVDARALGQLVAEEYARAGLRPEQVDTGAVIITGETARKENARAVLEQIASLAGSFVVATAGPDLESVLAAKGSGAVELSRRTGKKVLHMDIGGGTTNLAWIGDGKILHTACLDVGGRLVKLNDRGQVTYVSPVLHSLTELNPGDCPDRAEVARLARQLTRVLEMAAGLREATPLLAQMGTPGAAPLTAPYWSGEDGVISFSGGVADCVDRELPWLSFGDIGPLLGQSIRQSRLCQGEYRLGLETIRATVIGAGCHSAQLSGSTVYVRNVTLPMQNLPVGRLSEQEQALPPGALSRCIGEKLRDGAVLALPGWKSPGYARIRTLAREIAAGFGQREILVCVEQDMAKALGQCLALLPGNSRGLLCIDRVRLEQGSYLDVGEQVGNALPVVVKTLVFEQET